MAPRFVEVADPVKEGLNAFSSYIPSIFPDISLPDLHVHWDGVANRTARLCDALGPDGGFDALLRPVKGVPAPGRAALCLLAAAALLLLLRCAFLCCEARRILRTHGQTRHLNKDL